MPATPAIIYGGQQFIGPATVGLAGQIIVSDGAGDLLMCSAPTLPQLDQIGGCPISDLQSTVDIWNGGGSGRTIVLGGANYQIRQAGYVRQFRVGIPASADVGGGSAKVKIVRPVTPSAPTTTQWTVVGEYQITMPKGPLAFVVDLPAPIACLPGDFPAIWLDNSAQNSITADDNTADATVYFGNGNLTSGSTLASHSSGSAGIAVLDVQPFFAVTGDSIVAGHGSPSPSFTFRDVAGGYTTYFTSPTAHEVAFNIHANLGWRYQNFAKGGTTLSDALANGIPLAIASGARVIHLHSGVNDIDFGQTQSQMLANLNSIRSLVPQNVPLFVDEIMPWNVGAGGTDAFALATRQWNALLPAWCAANNATLILCHDVFGQTRVSTGQLDDLKTAYDSGDGIHPNTAGVTLLTTLVQAAMDGLLAIPQTIDGITQAIGDVLCVGPGISSATISSHSVTYAKMQQASTVTLLGNPTGGTANVQEITLGAGLAFSGTTLTASGSAPAFSAITTGSNTSATMTVGAGGTLTFASTGVVNANQLGGTSIGTPTGTTNVVFSASPTLTGTPLAPTATIGTNTTQIATTAFVSAVATLSNLASIGTITTGVWHGTAITPSFGGTGLGTLTAHAVVLGEGTSNVGFATIGTAGRVLIDQGAGVDPSFNAISGSGATITLSSAGVLTISAIANGSLANSSITLNTHSISLGSSLSLTASDIGLGSVTNDAQTKAAIVPNTAPSAGQILIGNAGGTAFAATTASGDATIASTGAISVSKIGGVAFGSLATQSTTPRVIATFVVDGSGSVVTTGAKATIVIPYAATITGWAIQGNLSGSAVCRFYKQAYATSSIPAVGGDITGSVQPTVTAAFGAKGTTLTGWTTAVSANDQILLNVDSCSTMTRIVVELFGNV